MISIAVDPANDGRNLLAAFSNQRIDQFATRLLVQTLISTCIAAPDPATGWVDSNLCDLAHFARR